MGQAQQLLEAEEAERHRRVVIVVDEAHLLTQQRGRRQFHPFATSLPRNVTYRVDTGETTLSPVLDQDRCQPESRCTSTTSSGSQAFRCWSWVWRRTMREAALGTRRQSPRPAGAVSRACVPPP